MLAVSPPGRTVTTRSSPEFPEILSPDGPAGPVGPTEPCCPAAPAAPVAPAGPDGPTGPGFAFFFFFRRFCLARVASGERRAKPSPAQVRPRRRSRRKGTPAEAWVTVATR